MAGDPAVIDEMLREAKNIAVVGMSDKPWRASHNIGKYLAAHGYRVFPVNPSLSEILGKQCYASLDDADKAARDQSGNGIDVVNVFRASENVPPIVDDVIHDAAVAKARAAGVKCVQDDCIYREHAARASK